MTTAIKRHYDQLNQNREEIRITEWEKTIYVGPLTYGQYQKIELGEKAASSERGFAIIEACAKDEDGSPAFGIEEIRDMRLYASPHIITRTAHAIMEAQNKFKEEDDKGN